jgi:butyryl-CoA dehydrogenase
MTVSTSTARDTVDVSDEGLAALTERLAATAARYDLSGDFPWDGITAAHEAGVLRIGIGAEYGGPQVSLTDQARVLSALGAGDASVALIVAQTIAQHTLQDGLRFWPDELYRQIVAETFERPILLNAVRAEPEWGAPARGGLPTTTVTKAPGGWLLNGHKSFATASEGLAYHLVWALEQTPDGPRVAHAIVPGDAAGIQIVKTWDHLGLRASSTHDVVYTDVFLPSAHFAGQIVAAISNDGVREARIAVSFVALYVGVARAAQDFLVRFAHERVPTSLGRPIATTERIQSVVGEVEAQLIQAEGLLHGLTRRVDAGTPVPAKEALVLKVLITRAAITAVQTAVAAIGNPGLTRANPLERHLRDVLCSRVHPPQEDAALLTLGKAVLGL